MTEKLYNIKMRDNARKLRSHGTLAEVLIWQGLKNRKTRGHRFLRQRILGPYITDFLCPALKLIIEIMGSSHREGRLEYDSRRDRFLRGLGYQIIYLSDQSVKQDLSGVFEHLSTRIEDVELGIKIPLERWQVENLWDGHR